MTDGVIDLPGDVTISSPAAAAKTAARAELNTLILTLYVPPMPLGGTEDDWRALAAEHFDGTIELGDDLHKVEIP